MTLPSHDSQLEAVAQKLRAQENKTMTQTVFGNTIGELHVRAEEWPTANDHTTWTFKSSVEERFTIVWVGCC